MSDSSEKDSPQWRESDPDTQQPPRKRCRHQRDTSPQNSEGIIKSPTHLPFHHLVPYPTFSIFSPPQAPLTWHLYQFNYPPPPQWYPIYSDHSADQASTSYSWSRSGPADAGPFRPPTAMGQYGQQIMGRHLVRIHQTPKMRAKQLTRCSRRLIHS